MDVDIELKPRITMLSTKSADLIGHIKFLPWGQLDGCSVTRPFLSLRRVWLARLPDFMTTEAVAEVEDILQPAPSEATLQDDSEPKEERNTPEVPLIQLESQIKSRVVTDEAEPADRTRTESLLRVPSQDQRVFMFSVVEEEDEDSDEGRDEGDAVFQENVLEEHIIDAIESEDVSAVQRWLVEEGTKVNECKGGRTSHSCFFVGDGTALHWAAYYGQLEIAQLLLDNGADPYEKARGGETVLHWACQSKVKNKELIEKLLTVRTDDQDPQPLVLLPDNKGWTPLHYACYDNNMKLVQQLLGAGADPNAKNDCNCTPLHLLNEDSDGILDLLDLNHLLPRTSDPVLQKDIIERIKSGDVRGFQKWLDGRRSRDEVNRYRGGFTIRNCLVLEGGTALHWAAYYGQRAIVDVLIEKEAGWYVLTSKKESVLHWACKGQGTNESLVNFLVDKVDVNFGDVDGYTALHYACWRGNYNIAEVLLKNKADRNAQALHGETPVSIAFNSRKKDLIDLLDKDHLLPRDAGPILETSIVDSIRDGEEIKVKDMTVWDINHKRGGKVSSNDFEVSGGTALHWAAYYGKVEIAKLLFEKGASPRVMDKNGETILHWACKTERENDKMVEVLLEKYVTKRTQPLTGEEETKVQVDSTNSEGYTALHYACWQGHQKVARLLKEAKADPRARSIKGYTPLDFAATVGKKKKWKLARMLDDRHLLPRAKFLKLEKCIIEGGYTRNVQRWLKSYRRNVDHCRDENEGGTALHWAAYYGRLDIVKMLIENGANPRARAYDNGTVLHWACKSEEGNRELVRLLVKKGCKLDDRDENGYTPFLVAASHGCQRVIEELLHWDRLRIAVNYRVLAPEAVFKAKESEGHSPLVRARLRGHHNVVKLLLKRGAKVEPQDLRAAIEEGNEHVVSDLLQSPQWPTLLRQSWEETTPFRELIKKMPDIAKQVLDRCVVSNPKTRDPKNKDFEVVLDYSFVEDHGNARCSSAFDEDSESKRKGKARKRKFNGEAEVCTNPKSEDFEDAPYEDGHARYSNGEDSEPKCYPEKKEEAHHMRFEEVKQRKGYTMKYGPPFKKSNHPLSIMVQRGRLEMLTHPVISSLLQHKWFHFGLWLYLLHLLIYVIFLVFLTLFALAVLSPQSNTCLQVFSSPGIGICENSTARLNNTGAYTGGSGSDSDMMEDSTTRERNETCITCELSSAASHFVVTSAVIVILIAGIGLLIEICQFYYSRKTFIRDLTLLLQVSLCILSIIFVSVFWTPCMCPQKWQWQIGVIAVLFAWTNLIELCAKFPSIGIYIIMFGKIVRTFLEVIIFSVLLLSTFAITLYMTFSVTNFQQSPFSTPGKSMIKILSMTAGDFSFDTVFRQSPSGESEDAEEILFPIISYLLWIIFLIIMPILFINLLVGLAVGDTSEIKNKSHLTKLALQVDVILTAEHMLRVLHIHDYFGTVPSPVVDTPNKTEKFSLKKGIKNIVYYLSGGEDYDAAIFQGALSYYLDSESEPEDQNEMGQVAESVKEQTMEAKQKHIEAKHMHLQHIEALVRLEEHVQNVKQMLEERMKSVEYLVEKRMQALEQLIKQSHSAETRRLHY